MNEKRRRLAGVGAMFAALLFSNGHIITLPDFWAGFLVGMAIVFMILSMLPDSFLKKVKEWKRHGI